MVTFAHAASRVKIDLHTRLAAAVEYALSEHPEFVWRDRLLNPSVLIWLFVLQILHGNVAISRLRHLANLCFTPAAYCKARMRMPLTLIESVAASIGRQTLDRTAARFMWKGHRMWKADATSASMPDTEQLQARFGQPGAQKPGCGFPTMLVLALTDAAGFIARTIPLPLRSHEAAHVADLHEHLVPGDVLLYDRAGCSFAHLALLLQQNLHAIVRMHQCRIVSFKTRRKSAGQSPKGKRRGKPRSVQVRRLDARDHIVRWTKPRNRPRWMTAQAYAALPGHLEIRELRYNVRRRGFRTREVTLATTLLDPRIYQADALAEQY